MHVSKYKKEMQFCYALIQQPSYTLVSANVVCDALNVPKSSSADVV